MSQTVASTTLTATQYQLVTTGVTGTIVAGMLLSGGAVSAGTYIVSQASGTVGGAGTYNVNQTYTGVPTGAAGAVVVLNQALQNIVQAGAIVQFSRYTYAVPGETVFSFISSPSNKDSLDLTPFKELTNTPIWWTWYIPQRSRRVIHQRVFDTGCASIGQLGPTLG